MSKYSTIYDMIIGEEAAYALPITVMDGWEWNMKEHIRTSLFYKHGRLLSGNTDDKPVKNITRPILNFQYRAEDIDLKDIDIYVDDSDKYHLSFLVKKYHDEVFIAENDLDSFFDEVKEEKIDFGGALAMKVKGVRPEKIPMQNIAFCNQTNILSGLLGLKYNFSPDELKDMADVHWGDDKYGATATLDEVIALSQSVKVPDRENGKQNSTPGNYIEIYIVRGTMPIEWLYDNSENPEENKYERQMQVVTFYKDDKGQKHGLTLFKGKDQIQNIKFIPRDKIENRALGFGGAEELFESQVWTNYSEIRKKDMIDAASKMIILTTDETFAQKNKLKEMDNLDIATVAEGKEVRLLDTYPRNLVLFDNWVNEWQLHAQTTGSAGDAVLGKSPSSGTPFKLQDAVITENHGLSEYRRGKYAKFIEELYRDWFIPHISQKIISGSKFLSELSADEMEYVANCVATSKWNEFAINKIIKGGDVTEEEKNIFIAKTRKDFAKGGSKAFIEILKGEMKDAALKVKVNILGKQKDLSGIVDKLTNIFRQIIANPAVLDDPRMMKIFNKIIQYSGLDPTDFASSFYQKPESPPQPTLSPLQPDKLVAKT